MITIFTKKKALTEIKELRGIVSLLKESIKSDVLNNCMIIKSNSNKYSSKTKTIYYKYDSVKTTDIKKGKWTAICHEFGHYIDDVMGRPSLAEDFAHALYTDASIFTRAYDFNKVSNDINRYGYTHGLSDILTGAIDGLDLKYRHSDKYYTKDGKLQKECFAHFFEATIRQDKLKIELYETYLPNAYNCFLKML